MGAEHWNNFEKTTSIDGQMRLRDLPLEGVALSTVSHFALIKEKNILSTCTFTSLFLVTNGVITLVFQDPKKLMLEPCNVLSSIARNHLLTNQAQHYFRPIVVVHLRMRLRLIFQLTHLTHLTRFTIRSRKSIGDHTQ